MLRQSIAQQLQYNYISILYNSQIDIHMFEEDSSLKASCLSLHHHKLQTDKERTQRIRKKKNIRKEKVTERRNQILQAESSDRPDLTREQRKEMQKEKNRIAAQHSRDRQKKYLEDLEFKVTELQKQVDSQLCRKCKAQLSEHSTSEEEPHESSSYELYSVSQSIDIPNREINLLQRELELEEIPFVRDEARSDFEWGNIGRYLCIFLVVLSVALLSSSVEMSSSEVPVPVRPVARILTAENPTCSHSQNDSKQCPTASLPRLKYDQQKTWPFKLGTGQAAQECKNNFWEHYLEKVRKQETNPYESNLVTCSSPNLIHISTVYEKSIQGKWTFLITNPTVSHVLLENDGGHHLQQVSYLDGVYQLVAENVMLKKVLGKSCLA